MHVTVKSARGGGVQLRGNYGCISVQNEHVHDYKYTNKLYSVPYLYINMSSRCTVHALVPTVPMYCITLLSKAMQKTQNLNLISNP